MLDELRMARVVLREGGVRALGHRAAYVIRRSRRSGPTLQVDPNDVMSAGWREGPLPYAPRRAGSDLGPLTIDWVMPPLWPGSGGHVTLFRMIGALERRGHRCRVVFYDPRRTQSSAEVRGMMHHFPPIHSDLVFHTEDMGRGDVLVATSWPTAYGVAASRGGAKRMYFVQDYEPAFYPVSTDSVLAEGSYRLGLHGVTMGRWLASELPSRFGMPCDPIDFQVDLSQYSLRNRAGRRGILFYARPVTPRRGYELGLLALERVLAARPDARVHLVGWPLGRSRPSFPHIDHGILDAAALNDVYNECAVGLVLSLTNMSLLPLELLASGCVPVVNDAPNTRMVLDHPQVRYVSPSPSELAAAVATTFAEAASGAMSEPAAKSVEGASWDRAGEQLETALIEAVRTPVAG